MDLVTYAATTWFTDNAMEHGLDVIRHTHPLRSFDRVWACSCVFWRSLQSAFAEGPLDYELRQCVQRFNTFRDTLETICFPVCHNNHWFAVFISLRDGSVQVADGLDHVPPDNLVPAVISFVSKHLKVETRKWKPSYERLQAPKQSDGHSCGPIALAMFEQEFSGENINWTPQSAKICRINWIRRCISLDAKWHESFRYAKLHHDHPGIDIVEIPDDEATGQVKPMSF
jgi:Ulp1 family protease